MKKRSYPMSDKDRRRDILRNRVKRKQSVPSKLLYEFGTEARASEQLRKQ